MATSYSNPGGSGYRIGEIDITTTATAGGAATVYRMIDGVNNVNGTAGAWFWSNGQTLREIVFDFQSGRSVVIDAFTWNQSNTASHGTWTFEASDDASSWTTIIASLTLGGATNTEYTGSNSTGYRYYRLRQTAGTTSSSPWLREITFKTEYANAALPLFTNTNGRGDRTSTITVTTDGTVNGTVDNLVDGALTANTTDAFWFDSGFGSNKEVLFDFTDLYIIDRFLWRASTTATHGTWDFQGSVDGVSWTTLVADFTLGGELEQVVNAPNATGYRYYRLFGPKTGSTSTGPYNLEMDFQIMPDVANDTRVMKNTGYAVMAAPARASLFKNTSYVVMEPPVVSSKGFKLTGYAVMEAPPDDAFVFKASSYAVMSPPPDDAYVMKTTAYSVMAPNTDAYALKVTGYAVMEPHPAQAAKITAYAVMSTGVIGAVHKVASYAVMEPHPARARKLSSYAVMAPGAAPAGQAFFTVVVN